MGIVPIYVWNHLLSADNRDGLVARSEQPVLPEEMEKRKMQFQRLQEQDPYLLERLVRLFRIFKAVYCPSSPRHMESATLISEFFKLPVPISDGRLDAVDYGNFKGQPLSSMKPPHNYVEISIPRWRELASVSRALAVVFRGSPPKTTMANPILLAGQTRAAIRMCAHLCDGINISDAVDLEVTDPNVPWVYFYKF